MWWSNVLWNQGSSFFYCLFFWRCLFQPSFHELLGLANFFLMLTKAEFLRRLMACVCVCVMLRWSKLIRRNCAKAHTLSFFSPLVRIDGRKLADRTRACLRCFFSKEIAFISADSLSFPVMLLQSILNGCKSLIKMGRWVLFQVFCKVRIVWDAVVELIADWITSAYVITSCIELSCTCTLFIGFSRSL